MINKIIKLLIKELSKQSGINDIGEYTHNQGYIIDENISGKEKYYFRLQLIYKHLETITEIKDKQSDEYKIHLASMWKFINEI
jgi:acid stress-induced BolA-like protein IbaG/YrbA